MSNEHASTGGDGGQVGHGPFTADERSLTDEDLDELFGLLANEQRRHVLDYLADTTDDVASLPELVDHVVDATVESSDREHVEMTLHHSHLPKLADANVVEYDPRSETVRYRGGREIGNWIDLVRSHERDT